MTEYHIEVLEQFQGNSESYLHFFLHRRYVRDDGGR